MDGRTITLQDGKPWRCENGHLLGVMRREKIGSAHGYRLYLLTCALENDPIDTQPMAWKARIEGTCIDILCEICGNEKSWYPGQAAMLRIVERRHVYKSI